LTGLEPKLGQIIRAGNPVTILEAVNRIKRELQLSYFENQKFLNKNRVQPSAQPNQKTNTKTCSYCKKNGHTINECRVLHSRQAQAQIQRPIQPQRMLTYPNNNSNSNFQQRPQFNQNQNRPLVTQAQPQNRFNSNASRLTQSNSTPQNNFRPNPVFKNNNQRTHHLNTNQFQNNPEYNNPELNNPELNNPEFNNPELNSTQYDTEFDNPDYDNPGYDNFEYNNSDNTNFNFENDQNSYCPNAEHYSQYSSTNTFSQYIDQPNFSQCNVNFRNEASEISEITNQIQTMNMQEDFNPNLNFSEQIFI
jgi:hypothetical protein